MSEHAQSPTTHLASNPALAQRIYDEVVIDLYRAIGRDVLAGARMLGQNQAQIVHRIASGLVDDWREQAEKASYSPRRGRHGGHGRGV